MKRPALALALAALSACQSLGGGGGASGYPSDPRAGGYRLVWADEFDTPGRPDSANWGYENGFVRNQEDQFYHPDNARVEGGMLVIEGRREARPNPRFAAGSTDWRASRQVSEFTSASLTSRGKRSWQYGRFEMRGRFSASPGLWPAWWTLGVAGPWPSNGEIDIMEFYRGMLLANVAWGTAQRNVAKWDDLRKPITDFGDPAEWSSRFHVWRMDWDEEEIRLYVDGLLLNTTDLEETVNGDAEGRNPLRQPHYMILNLAIGGTNGGDPSTTTFPTRYEVDYVWVYQR